MLNKSQNHHKKLVKYIRQGRSKIENTLTQSKSLFAYITENMLDLVSVLTNEGLYKYVSPSYYDVLGYKAADLQNSHSLNMYIPKI